MLGERLQHLREVSYIGYISVSQFLNTFPFLSSTFATTFDDSTTTCTSSDLSESSLEASEVSIGSSVNTSKLLSEVKEQLSKLKIGGAEDCAGKSPVTDKRAGRDMPPLIDLTVSDDEKGY